MEERGSKSVFADTAACAVTSRLSCISTVNPSWPLHHRPQAPASCTQLSDASSGTWTIPNLPAPSAPQALCVSDDAAVCGHLDCLFSQGPGAMLDLPLLLHTCIKHWPRLMDLTTGVRLGDPQCVSSPPFLLHGFSPAPRLSHYQQLQQPTDLFHLSWPYFQVQTQLHSQPQAA